jgi:hypothetical protein
MTILNAVLKVHSNSHQLVQSNDHYVKGGSGFFSRSYLIEVKKRCWNNKECERLQYNVTLSNSKCVVFIITTAKKLLFSVIVVQVIKCCPAT